MLVLCANRVYSFQLMLKTDIPPTARDVFAFGKLIAYAMPYIQPYLPGRPLENSLQNNSDRWQKLFH